MDTFQEIKDILKELAISQNRTDSQIAKLEAAQLKTDAQLAKTDAQLAKTIRKLDAIGVQLGDLGHSNGEAAESFFYNSLEEKKMLGKVKFDEVAKNIKQKKHRTEDEYDVFMENGNAVGIVEVKYKVTKEHINKLLEKKPTNFRILFPDYSQYKLYMGIAGFSFEPETEKMALDNGLVVLKQKGDVLQVESSTMKAF